MPSRLLIFLAQYLQRIICNSLQILIQIITKFRTPQLIHVTHMIFPSIDHWKLSHTSSGFCSLTLCSYVFSWIISMPKRAINILCTPCFIPFVKIWNEVSPSIHFLGTYKKQTFCPLEKWQFPTNTDFLFLSLCDSINKHFSSILQ